jgi:hypothetical protein
MSAFARSWEQFLMEIVLLEDHPGFYMLNSIPVGTATRHPFVDQLAPRVLYVKMVALLDEALIEYLDTHGLALAHPYRNDLNGRIEFLRANGVIANPVELHRIRRRRNALAHEADALASWTEINADAAILHAELRHLAFVGEQPKFDSFAERDVDLSPKLPGIAMVQKFRVGLRTGDVVRAEVTWSRAIYRLGWDEERVKEALARGEPVPVGQGVYGEEDD